MILFIFITSQFVSTFALACDTPILEYSALNTSLTTLLGSTSDYLSRQSIPVLNSNSYWLARSINHNTIQFNLFDAFGTNFTITGFALQQKVDNNSECIDAYEQASLFQIGYKDSGILRSLVTSNSPLGLFSLNGLTDDVGRIVKVRIPPITTDYIQISKYSVLPDIRSYCIRVELYGCVATENTTNTPAILQYSYPNVTLPIVGTLYSDMLYTGICSFAFCTGGTGILTDGDIGQSRDDATQFIGWHNPNSIKIRIDFEEVQFISNISIYGLDFRNPAYAEIPDTVTVNRGQTYTILLEHNQTPLSNEINAIFQPPTIYRITVPFGMTSDAIEINFGIKSDVNLMLTEISIPIELIPKQPITTQVQTTLIQSSNAPTSPSILSISSLISSNIPISSVISASSPTNTSEIIILKINTIYIAIITGLILVILTVIVLLFILVLKTCYKRMPNRKKKKLTLQNDIHLPNRITGETTLQDGVIHETRNQNYEQPRNDYESVNLIESQSILTSGNSVRTDADNRACEISLTTDDTPTTYSQPFETYDKLKIGPKTEGNNTTQFSEMTDNLDTGYSQLQYK